MLYSNLKDLKKNTEESHRKQSEAEEPKYSNLIEEQNALVRHLEAELDKIVNLMPIDHGLSRMIEEEETDGWVEVKSRDISQYYDDDDGLDRIITKLHGAGE